MLNISFSIRKMMKNPPVNNGIKKLINNRFDVGFHKLSFAFFAFCKLKTNPVIIDKTMTEAAMMNNFTLLRRI